MEKRAVLPRFAWALALALLAGCGGSSGSSSIPPLSSENTNLVFVVSPDLAYQTAGDVNSDTANLSSQGLQRSLMLASYLKQQVLGGGNVAGIYALAPMTHLQTTNQYPDMVAIGFIQEFALLNQITLPTAAGPYTANSYPINVSYAPGAVPAGVALPTPPLNGLPSYSPGSTGLDFNNTGGDNDSLVSGIIDKKAPGYHVFSAPWETTSALLAFINTHYNYQLSIPTTYLGANYVYAISIPSSGTASLVTYNSQLNPPASYPVLPAPVATTSRTNQYQSFFHLQMIGGVDGVVVPPTINTNSRVYIVRHAEAHPDSNSSFEDGNYVAAGQWRALSLANALSGKISPDVVYSIDPAGMWYPNGNGTMVVSYIRPSLTLWPYAIANNLPYHLASELSLGSAFNPTDTTVAQDTSNYFFTGGKFSNQTVLVGWESGHIRPLLKALIDSYGGNNIPDLSTSWPSLDYDTIWSVTLDAEGNLTVDNSLCEGIDSAKLPATAPLF